jgi:hypothetical protein
LRPANRVRQQYERYECQKGFDLSTAFPAASEHCLNVTPATGIFSKGLKTSGQIQMDKSALAMCTCIVTLYLLDAAFFKGEYFASAISMLSELRTYF